MKPLIRLFSIITFLNFLHESIYSRGLNPKMDGRGNWTSTSYASAHNMDLFLLIFVGIVIFLILSIFLYTNKSKLSSFLGTVIGLIGIGLIFILAFAVELLVRVFLAMFLALYLPEHSGFPQWLGGLLGIAVVLTLGQPLLVRYIKRKLGLEDIFNR